MKQWFKRHWTSVNKRQMKDGKQMREDLGIPQLNDLRISKCEGYSKGVFQEEFITLNAYSRKERS